MQFIYVMDPMCSWCWAFREPLIQLRQTYPDIPMQLMMGGLAPDSGEPMSESMREKIESIWTQIAAQTGAVFNHQFWRENEPKRSTYPACRAVLVARELGGPDKQSEMVDAIQSAYYQRALNPSNTEILLQLAEELNLDPAAFEARLNHPETVTALENEIASTRSIGISGFPALILRQGDHLHPLALGYSSYEKLESRMNRALANCE